MKAYTYTASECGLDKLPLGTLRLAGFEATRNPQEADAFVIPCDLRYLNDAQIHNLPHLLGNEAKHVLFCISDRPTRFLGFPGIFFRADCNKTLMQADPTTIAWPWPVNPKGDIDDYIGLKNGFERDVCFVGWNSTRLTDQACDSVQKHPGLTSFVQLNREFYGTWETRQETDKLTHFRNLFLQTMSTSRLSLCARSIEIGVVRYRFYEAMAMGRIPVHINDGASLPLPSKIDYDKCSISIPENRVGETGAILRDWLDHHSDADIMERGLYGREMWERWLDGRNWDITFGYCVSERLAGRM